MPPSRRLSPAEQALWARVVAGVRRAKGSAAEASATDSGNGPPLASSSWRAARIDEPDGARTPPTSATGSRPVRAVRQNTLDASWDRKLSTGTVLPDVTIDLHGCTLDQAHDRLDHGLARAIAHGARVVLLVTGKAPRPGTSRLDLPLRGIIRASVMDWLSAGPHTGQIAAVRPAHPRHGGAGALYIVIRRYKK